MNHFGASTSVILLRRRLARAVKSFMDLGSFTPRNPHWQYWCASPNAKSAAVAAPARDDEMDPIDCIIGYVIDVEARAQRFKKQHPDVSVAEVRLRELNERSHVEALFDKIGVEPSEKTWETVGRPSNRRTKQKEGAKGVSEAYCQERIHRYINRCKKQGIALPALPHL